jgi:putative intracellular protease/amidase
MKEVLFVLLDQYADWEAAPLAAAVNRLDGWCVKTVTPDGQPVRSIGGFCVTPDFSVKEALNRDFCGVVLIGGNCWRTPQAVPVAALVQKAAARGTVLAGICDASVYLGAQGMLNTARHTSNQLEDLQAYAGEHYTGAARYQLCQAVRDGKLVTANGTANMEFGREVLLALGAMTEPQAQEWYRLYKLGWYEAESQ